MSIITSVPEPNLWELICIEAKKQQPPFPEDDAVSVNTSLSDYDPAKHTPVFYGKLHAAMRIDGDELEGFDPSISHPACVGYAFVDRPSESPPPTPAPPPPKDACAPRVYLENYIFPVLLPALEAMLRAAKLEKCFERKRTKFNALDFLTEFLYKNNPAHDDRHNILLWDIPFVEEWLKDHPRPPLPKSLLWSDEEASLIIQSFWRGFKVRCADEVQELRQWQQEWREENEDIQSKVSDFWARQIPGRDPPTPSDSTENLTEVQNSDRIDRPLSVSITAVQAAQNPEEIPPQTA